MSYEHFLKTQLNQDRALAELNKLPQHLVSIEELAETRTIELVTRLL